MTATLKELFERSRYENLFNYDCPPGIPEDANERWVRSMQEAVLRMTENGEVLSVEGIQVVDKHIRYMDRCEGLKPGVAHDWLDWVARMMQALTKYLCSGEWEYRSGIEFRLLGLMDKVLTLLRQQVYEKVFLAGSDEILERIRERLRSVVPSPEWMFHKVVFPHTLSKRAPAVQSCRSRDTWAEFLTALVSKLRSIWDHTTVGEMVVARIQPDIFDSGSAKNILVARLFTLFTANEFCYDVVEDGRFFTWWSLENSCVSSGWETAWVQVLNRAVKHGWATGRPLIAQAHRALPRIVEHLCRVNLRLPPLTEASHVFIQESPELGEYNRLLVREASYKNNVASVIVYTLQPLALVPKDAEIQETADGIPCTNSFQTLMALLRLIASYTHSEGVRLKNAKLLGHFCHAVGSSYRKRVSRERSLMARVEAGHFHDGTSYRLGRREDLELFNVLMPICIQEQLSSNAETKGQGEQTAAFLGEICPVESLQMLLKSFSRHLAAVTEPGLLITACAAYARFLRKLLIYAPMSLSPLLAKVEDVKSGDPFLSGLLMNLFRALMESLPPVDASGVDLYGVDWEKVAQVHIPLFGYKTEANKDLFNNFFATHAIDSARNYPDERLGDSTEGLKSDLAQPVDSGEESMTFLVCWFDTPESVQQAAQQRLDFVLQSQSMVVDIFHKCLELMENMVTDSDELLQKAPGRWTFMMELMCAQMNDDTLEACTTHFCSWVMRHALDKVRDLGRIVSRGLADAARENVDTVAIMLKVFEPALITREGHPCLDTPVTKRIWLTNLVGGICDGLPHELVPKYLPRLTSIIWAMSHSENTSVYSEAMRGMLSLALSHTIIIPRMPYKRAGIDPLQELLQMGMRRNFQLDTSSWELQLRIPPTVWRAPKADQLDLWLSFLAAVPMEIARHWQTQLMKHCQGQLTTTLLDVDELRRVLLAGVKGTVSDFPELKVEITSFDAGTEGEKTKNPVTNCWYRVMLAARWVVATLESICPDDREAEVEGLPWISGDLRNVGQGVHKCLNDFAIRTLRHFMGLEIDVDEFRYEAKDPVDKTGDLDLARSIHQLAYLLENAFVRGMWLDENALFSKRLKDWLTMLLNLDTQRGVFTHDPLPNPMSQIDYTVFLFSAWTDLHSARRQSLPFLGERRRSLAMLYCLATWQYSNARKTAQMAYWSCMMRTPSAIDYTVQHAVDQFREACEVSRQLDLKRPTVFASPRRPPTADESSIDSGQAPLPETAAVAGIPPSDVPSAAVPESILKVAQVHPAAEGQVLKQHVEEEQQKPQDLVTQPPPVITVAVEPGESGRETNPAVAETTDKEKLAVHARLTGLYYLLGDQRGLSFLVATEDAWSRLVMAVVDRLSIHVDIQKQRERCMNLTLHCMDRRYEHAPIVTRALLSKLLERVEGTGPEDAAIHWRGRFVALVCLASILNEHSVVGYEERLFVALTKMVDPSLFSSYLTVTAGWTLMVLMKLCLSKKIPVSETMKSQVKDTSAVASFYRNVLNAQTHLKGKKPGEEKVMNLVIECVRIHRSWPVTRTKRAWAEMSQQVLLMSQTMAQFLHRFLGIETTRTLIARDIRPILDSWADHPVSDDEVHAACIQTIAGILRATRMWQDDERRSVWMVLQTPLASQMVKVGIAKSQMFSDAGRYVISALVNRDKFPPAGTPFAINTKSFKAPETFVTGIVNLMTFGAVKDDAPIKLPTPSNIAESSSTSGETSVEQQGSLHDQRRINTAMFLLATSWGAFPQLLRFYVDNMIAAEWMDSPHQAVRRDVAWALASLQASSNRQATTWTRAVGKEDAKGIVEVAEYAQQRLDDLLTRLVPGLYEELEKDRLRMTNEGRKAERTPKLDEIKTVMDLFVIRNASPGAMCCRQQDLGMIPLFICAHQHPDEEIKEEVAKGLGAICENPRGVFNFTFYDGLQTILEELVNHQDWQRRELGVRYILITALRNRAVKAVMGDQCEFALRQFEKLLTDSNTAVASACRTALQTLAMTLDAETCQKETTSLRMKAGDPRDAIQAKELDRIGAVLGLAAYIGSAPLTVPVWLPEVITQFAKFGGRRSPDHVRRVVESTLQEFFKSHKKNWNAEFAPCFTRQQKDILDEFKGIPIYFS